MTSFILGAGFNVDATSEAGPLFADSICAGHYQIDCGYPLVAETLRLCFNLDALPAGRSIEDLFADAELSRNHEPIQALAQRLRYADYRIAHELASRTAPSSYREFFSRFKHSRFLTFNYDSLPETFLFRIGCWHPHDGYGVRVRAPGFPCSEESIPQPSRALVLHLHGSLCIRTDEYEALRKSGEVMRMLTMRDAPLYTFAPSSIAGNFPGLSPGSGSDDVEDRVIAPIPDKAEALKAPFIRETYTKAEALMRDSDIVVAIGYSFNPHDRASFNPLLRALAESAHRRLLVVSPDAGKIADAIAPVFPKLTIQTLNTTLKQWARANFSELS